MIFSHKFSSTAIYSDISDHLPIAINMNMKKDTIRPKSEYTKRIYSPEIIKKFKDALNFVSWDDICIDAENCLNVSNLYERFNNKFVELFDFFSYQKLQAFQETHSTTRMDDKRSYCIVQ